MPQLPRPRRRSASACALALAIATATACGASPSDDALPLADEASGSRVEASTFPVTIRLPSSLGTVDTELQDAQGSPVGVGCATCHGLASQRPMAERSGLERFHQGVELEHGALSCETCHPTDDRTELRLADDTRLPFREVQRLCAQCHGPQHRDYVHGAHGGMRGYWDLTRGPRERNACIVCHAAHAPAYPKVLPAPPPRDRFLERADSAEVPHG